MTTGSTMPLMVVVLLSLLIVVDCESTAAMLAPSIAYLRGMLRRDRATTPMPQLIDEDVWPLLSSKRNFSKLRSTSTSSADDYDKCLRDIELLVTSAFPGRQSWALKYIDAWAKPPTGIMNGNFFWYGDFDECLSIEPVTLRGNVTLVPQYCRLGLSPVASSPNDTVPQTIMQFNSALTIGVCVPKSCSGGSLGTLVESLLPIKSGLHVAHAATYCQQTDIPLSEYSFIAIGIFSALGFFIALGLLIDLARRFGLWIYSWRKSVTANSSLTDLVFGDGIVSHHQPGGYSNLDSRNVRHRLSHHHNNNGSTNNISRVDTEDDPMAAALCDGDSASLVLPLPASSVPANGIERPLAADNHNINAGIVNTHQGRPKTPVTVLVMWRKLARVLVCFSPYTNMSKLFTLPPYSDAVPNLNSLHAIRVISIFWVILGHVYVFSIGWFDDIWTATEWPKRFSFQFIMAGLFAVDSFFFLSGFFAYWSLSRQFDLLVHPPHKTTEHRNRFWFWKSLPFVYIHRYLRLTPPYLAIILIDFCLWPYLSNGPFYFQGVDQACSQYWWSNILYVNNFMDMASQCVGWGWYLAVDMQLFLFAPFIVVLFSWRPRWAWAVSITALVAQAATTVTLTYVYGLPSSMFAPPTGNSTVPLPMGDDAYSEYFTYIYIKPYCRLGPYVVGIIFGHIVVRHSLYLTRNFFNRSLLPTLLWLLCIITMFSLIYGQFGVHAGTYTNPLAVDALYNAVARTAWGLALGWIVLAAVVNRAGPFGRVLSWPGWALPAKLTYSAYLTHPLLLIFFAQVARRPFHAADLSIALYYCGVLVLTFMVSTLFSLVFESPIISMQRLGSATLSY